MKQRISPQEEALRAKKAVVNKPSPTFYDSASEISHTKFWADGEQIYIANGANWDIYSFNRTDSKNPDGGNWVKIGTTSGTLTW